MTGLAFHSGLISDHQKKKKTNKQTKPQEKLSEYYLSMYISSNKGYEF